MVAAQRHTARGSDHAILIEYVVSRAAADVDHQTALRFGITIQHDLRGRDRCKDNVLNFQRNFAHTLDCILNPTTQAMDDVVISLQDATFTSDRMAHTFLTIDDVLPRHAV